MQRTAVAQAYSVQGGQGERASGGPEAGLVVAVAPHLALQAVALALYSPFERMFSLPNVMLNMSSGRFVLTLGFMQSARPGHATTSSFCPPTPWPCPP